jgi:NRPS condensation-like uncharacterized protein
MNFVVYAERRSLLETTDIHTALRVLQSENGLLNARIVDCPAQGLRFESAPNQLIDLACHTVQETDWLHRIESELSQPFAPGSAPLVRCVYLQIKETQRSVLGLCCHHSVADGRSGAALLSRLLTLIATKDKTPKIAHAQALAPMLAVFPKKFDWTAQSDHASQVKANMMTDYRRHGALSDIAWLNKDAPERTPRIIRLSLPPAASLRLLELSREHNTTVHGVLCAAQLLAQFKQQTKHDASTFFLSCPADMRAHLEPVQPTTPTKLYVTLIAAAFCITTETKLWGLAQDIISQTRRQLARGEGHLFFSLYGLNDQPVKLEQAAIFKKRSQSSWPNTMVSNLGRIDTVAVDPDVQHIAFALCPMAYQTVFTAASTYHDQLVLNLGFDAGKLAPQTAQALADDMLEILLGV